MPKIFSPLHRAQILFGQGCKISPALYLLILSFKSVCLPTYVLAYLSVQSDQIQETCKDVFNSSSDKCIQIFETLRTAEPALTTYILPWHYFCWLLSHPRPPETSCTRRQVSIAFF